MSRGPRRRVRAALGALVCGALLTAPAHGLTPAEEARIELTTYATIYGAGVGVLAALEFDLNPRPAAWLSAALAGGALWGTWEAAKARDLQPNQAGLISSTAVWTMVDMLLVHAAFDVLDDDEAIWLTLGGGAAAAGLAFALAPYYETSVGDLSLINSGGIWMPIALTLAAAPAWDTLLDHPFLWILTTQGLGLGAGALLAQRYEPTRQQALYLDAGLGIGLVGGGLLGVIGGVLTDSVEVASLLALGGMVAGGLVAANTAGLDDGAPVAQDAAPLKRRAPPPPVPLWVGVW